MHTWAVIAFLLCAAAAVLAGAQKAWALALLAAGIAAWIVPVAFNVTS